MKKEKRKDFWIVFLNICLALITIVLLGYIAYKNGHINLDNILNVKKEESKTEREEEDLFTSDNGDLTLNVYEGEIIEAILPDGWSIVEHFDGEGSDMLPSYTSYRGLTGLEILSNEKQILELEAAWGVGFVECPKLYVFSDTNSEYIAEIQTMSNEMDSETEIIDYSDIPYTEFTWLGRYFRRVDNYLFYDTNVDTEGFDSPCQTVAISLPLLSFTIVKENTEVDTYFYTINENAITEELVILDKILESMSVR
ncbi:MAG: hypothetical protein WCY00_01575 [Candidatus Dojkabacteria bacterium]|jgi:hypothetical protein